MATRDTSKDVTHEQTTGKLSEKAKQTAASLQGVGQMPPGAGETDTSQAQEILGNIYDLMVKAREWQLQERDDQQKEEKDKNKLKDIRNKDILEALKSIRVAKLPERDERGRFKKAEKPGETKPEAKPTTKGTEKPVNKASEVPPKGVKKQVTKEAEAAKKTTAKETKQTQKKAETEQKQAAQRTEKPVEKPKAEVVKPPPSPAASGGTTGGVSTATKVVGGIGLATAASASMAAGPLAQNIVAHESKVSSPQGNKKTKWKNDTEYNAYNKGTIKKKNKNGQLYDSIVPADFDEKGESVIDFSKMTIEEFLKRGSLESGNPNKILAMGRYQIIPKTMNDIVTKLNLDPKTTVLDKDTQDYLFMAGLIGKKRPKVKQYIDGDPKVTRNEAIMQLAQEFASIGVPEDTTYEGRNIKKGQSFYSQNSKSGFALNSPEEVGKALDAQRALNLQQKQKTSTVPQSTNTGNQIDQSSKENKDLKNQIEKNKSGAVVNNQINNVSQPAAPATSPKFDDTPAYLRKKDGR